MTPQTQMNHPGELKLRALHAGEAVADDVRAHAAGCDECRGRVKGFEDEQRRFEAELPFERFAAGVERARRTPRQVAQATGFLVRAPFARLGLALAACLALAVGVQLVRGDERHGNGLKGGAAGVEVVVAGAAQRPASEDPATPEALAPGERVRFGLRAGTLRYGIVVSVDEAGTVTPIYVDGAQSLALSGGAEVEYLPDSLEFTGAGLERVIVVLSHQPLSLDELSAAVKARYDEARGNLTQLGTLDVPGEQFHRTFLKP